MATDLTVDNLCEAIHFFLQQIAKHPEQPVDQSRGLVLCGVPGDGEMKALMELFGGEIRITVRELLISLQECQTMHLESSLYGGASLWHPEAVQG